MYWILERDRNTRIFRESSSLSSNDHPNKLRLNPLPDVKVTLDHQRAPIIVLKPLVESQSAVSLLEHLKGSRVLWLYRHYRDVASSYVGAFGIRNGIDGLRSIVSNEANNWRSETVSANTRAIVCQYFSEDMNPYDAVALFWFTRNQLFFDLALQHNQRVLLCRYEDLCKRPAFIMREIYAFIKCAYPGDHIVQDVHPRSVGKGEAVQFFPEIDALCAGLLSDLNNVNPHNMPS